jgi:hypothetical protein
MSTGPFISLLATYTIMFDMHIAMVLFSLVSLLSLSVSVVSMCIIFANVSHLATHEFHDDAGFRKFRHCNHGGNTCSKSRASQE